MPSRTRKKRSPATDFSAKTRVIVSTAVGLAASAVVLLIQGGDLAPVAGWDTGAGFFLLWMWGSIWSLDAHETARHAVRENPGRAVADALLLSASVVSLAAV